MHFRSIYRHGMARVAACVPLSAIANPAMSAEGILDLARQCHQRAVAVAIFPELCLSGYAIEDLLLQDALNGAVVSAIDQLVTASAELMPVLIVGAPVRHKARL